MSGGYSSRMGKPKDRIVLSDGRCMIQHVVEVLLCVCNEVVVAGPEIPELLMESERVHFVHDNFPGQGPLAGIEAILGTGYSNGYVIAACDQPLLTEEILRMLIPESRDMPCFFEAAEGQPIQPLPGYYPVTWLADIRDSLRRNRRALKGLIAESDVVLKPMTAKAAWCLQSINTEDDLSRLTPFLG